MEKTIEDLLRENIEIKQKLDILLERTNESLCTTKNLEIVHKLLERTNDLCTTKNLEMVAAKIVKEVKEETKIVSKETDITAFPKNGKYSYSNFDVRNKELGSSGNPKALPLPPVQKSNIKLLES